jgi:hypothetical protein
MAGSCEKSNTSGEALPMKPITDIPGSLINAQGQFQHAYELRFSRIPASAD